MFSWWCGLPWQARNGAAHGQCPTVPKSTLALICLLAMRIQLLHLVSYHRKGRVVCHPSFLRWSHQELAYGYHGQLAKASNHTFRYSYTAKVKHWISAELQGLPHGQCAGPPLPRPPCLNLATQWATSRGCARLIDYIVALEALTKTN